MRRRCSVENCPSDSTKPEHAGVTFHKLPPHSDVRPKWMSLCRIPEEDLNKVVYVCSRHFLRADFCNFKGRKYILKQGVLPSVFPWDKSKLKAIISEGSIKTVTNSHKKGKGRNSGKKHTTNSCSIINTVTESNAVVETSPAKQAPTPEPIPEKIESINDKIEVKSEEVAAIKEISLNETQETKSEVIEIKTEDTSEAAKTAESSIEAENSIKIEHSMEDEHSIEAENSVLAENSLKAENSMEAGHSMEAEHSMEAGKSIGPTEEPLEEPLETSKSSIIKESLPSSDPDTSKDTSDHEDSAKTPISTGPITFELNTRLEVLDNSEFWYPARIKEIDYEESEVLIHFEKCPSKSDEWIAMGSSRLRAIPRPTQEDIIYEVGDKCLALWNQRKFPATITKKLENNTFEVLFEDGFVKVLKKNKISKISDTIKVPTVVTKIETGKASPLFDPVTSTKEERRKKKRKLNVAELFHKKPRLSILDDKKTKDLSSSVLSPNEDMDVSLQSDHQEINVSLRKNSAKEILDWLPSWENGKPVGVDSTIELMDGLRKSVIVPDPRLPAGWTKHLSQRIQGTTIGKWDVIILAPDGKKFRSRNEIRNYLDLHPGVEAREEMFVFNIYRGQGKRRAGRTKVSKSVVPEPQPPIIEPLLPEVKTDEIDIMEEGLPELTATEPAPLVEKVEPALKIIFENNSYRCPIEGCGKNFRRENLALMHVKHYHREFTKFLDSTPNVADLAYARTVNDSLEKSANTRNKADKCSATPKLPKQLEAPISDADMKTKDSEIIKLLNKKTLEVSNDMQPLPPGLPSNMYPEINLKDLLGKNDDISMRDDINIKNLCSSRPSQGIKTLLPVRHALSNEISEDKVPIKRKRLSDAVDSKGRYLHHQHSAFASSRDTYPMTSHLSPSLSQPNSFSVGPSIPTAFDLAPPPADLEMTHTPTVTQFDGVIIEGGKIIKLERMKQEEIINCTCGFIEEDGLMIQCELCLCWQHAYCNNIVKESEVPEKYICFICQNPQKSRRSQRFLNDQDWMNKGTLPIGSYHSVDKEANSKRFEKLKKCHDIAGTLTELHNYMHSLGVKSKIAEQKDHPKLYLWSKPWDKPRLPIKVNDEPIKEISTVENDDEFVKHASEDEDKQNMQNDSMFMMMLKPGNAMLNMHSNLAPIIPRPAVMFDSTDCRLHLLDHIMQCETLVEERLEDLEKQLDVLEEGLSFEDDDDFSKTKDMLQLLNRDLNKLQKFSELPNH